MSKQTKNKRKDGKFAKGNTLGNRWKKGQSGNPNGRRNAYTDLIREFSFQKINDKADIVASYTAGQFDNNTQHTGLDFFYSSGGVAAGSVVIVYAFKE